MIAIAELIAKKREDADEIIRGLDYQTVKMLTAKAYEAYCVYARNHSNGVETEELKRLRKRAWDVWGKCNDRKEWLDCQIERRYR